MKSLRSPKKIWGSPMWRPGGSPMVLQWWWILPRSTFERFYKNLRSYKKSQDCLYSKHLIFLHQMLTLRYIITINYILYSLIFSLRIKMLQSLRKSNFYRTQFWNVESLQYFFFIKVQQPQKFNRKRIQLECFSM